jgi:hypothetical protein
MSDYSKSTNFASKDSLTTGNPLKVIKGTEIDDEFEAIETHIATKADLASPTFTGTPKAPTAATGTNTTQIATTAFVTTAVNALELYPVGSIYINATDSTNPSTLLGYGTWVAFGEGRVLVGLDSSDTDFDTAEETGGSKTHTLTVDEIPAHTHSYDDWAGAGTAGGSSSTDSRQTTSVSKTSGSTGGGDPHNNLQPYITVYMWKRTA